MKAESSAVIEAAPAPVRIPGSRLAATGTAPGFKPFCYCYERYRDHYDILAVPGGAGRRYGHGRASRRLRYPGLSNVGLRDARLLKNPLKMLSLLCINYDYCTDPLSVPGCGKERTAPTSRLDPKRALAVGVTTPRK